MSELNEDKRTKGAYMTTEEILKEISDAIKLNNESKVTSNEALCHAGNVIRSLENKLKEEYERGTKDAWDLARKICGYKCSGSNCFTYEELLNIFGTEMVAVIMDTNTYENAKKKMEEYLTKKEENDKPGPIIKGDIVMCISRDNDCKFYEGIYMGKDSTDYYIFAKEDKSIHILMDDIWRLTKTGKHVDLDW